MEDIKIIRNNEEFYKLKEEWTALELESDISYYSSYEYNSIWWDSVKELGKYKLFVITIRKNGIIQGIAPLVIKKEKYLSIKSLRFMAWGDTLNFIIKKEKNNNTMKIINKILRVIKENGKDYDRVALTNISSDTYLAKTIFKNFEYNKKFNMMMECPQLYFKKYLDYEEYRKNNEPGTVRTQRNSLRKEVDYQIIFEKNKKENRYELIKNLHVELQKNRRKKLNMFEKNSPFFNQEYDNFLEKLYNKSENVYNYLLTDNQGNVISYLTGYLFKNIYHGWNCGYDFKYNDYSLGRITFYEAINNNFNNENYLIWDLGWGKYSWKFQLTEDYISLYELRWWNNPRLDKLEKTTKKIIDIFKILKN